MTKFQEVLKNMKTEKIEWCIDYLKKNGEDFSNPTPVQETIKLMEEELKSR